MAKLKVGLVFLFLVIPKQASSQNTPPPNANIPDLIGQLLAALENLDSQVNETRLNELPKFLKTWENSNQIINKGIENITPLNLILMGSLIAIGASIVAMPCVVGCHWIKLKLKQRYQTSSPAVYAHLSDEPYP